MPNGSDTATDVRAGPVDGANPVTIDRFWKFWQGDLSALVPERPGDGADPVTIDRFCNI